MVRHAEAVDKIGQELRERMSTMEASVKLASDLAASWKVQAKHLFGTERCFVLYAQDGTPKAVAVILTEPPPYIGEYVIEGMNWALDLGVGLAIVGGSIKNIVNIKAAVVFETITAWKPFVTDDGLLIDPRRAQ